MSRQPDPPATYLAKDGTWPAGPFRAAAARLDYRPARLRDRDDGFLGVAHAAWPDLARPGRGGPYRAGAGRQLVSRRSGLAHL